jgi:dienelactone hydrolase
MRTLNIEHPTLNIEPFLPLRCSMFNVVCSMFVFILLAVTTTRAKADYDPDTANKTAFTTSDITWHDADRNRDVPAKIYYPTDAKGPMPIIIFSHGLGGSRDGYSYLGKYWASHGYVAVHLTHIGSDTAAVRAGGLDNIKETELEIARDPMDAVDRCRDVSFTIDKLRDVDHDKTSAMEGKLDLDRIGIAGHSFGANTTMLISGELTRSGKTIFADDRVKAAIAFSPPIATAKSMWDKVYEPVHIPLFVMTGTLDDSPVGDTRAIDRRVPFDHVQGIPAYLITFTNGDHQLFSGRETPNRPATDERYHKLILQGSLAFWDAYLRGDEPAKKWLSDGGFEKLVGDAGKFEVRNIK